MSETAVAAEVARSLRLGLWLIDAGGATLFRNDAWSAQLGAALELDELIDRMPGVPVRHYVDRAIAAAATFDEPAVLFRPRSGPAQLLELHVTPGPLERTALICIREVTDRTRLQRLGALVETAIALSHEIANPLAILRGELALLHRQSPATGPEGTPSAGEGEAGDPAGGADRSIRAMERAAERIDQVLERMRHLTDTAPTEYLHARGVRMLDLGHRAGNAKELSQ